MATIKPIEGRTIHQIQSGQVIVDLCSVVKELVENSLDAGASNIEIRFKNQGLDSIEVQDNGDGITTANYETVALKHHTSKISSYSDLDTLQTFGFRGEALSSLCALSRFTITTCLASDAPKGTKLEFETSGKLNGTNIVAAQKGTTVTVENLFQTLPVRRRELERNVKREWNRVVGLLGQYACIQTGVKISVSQQTPKGKKTVLFSTNGNTSTRENIVNVFGAKTLNALLPLNLKLEFEPTRGPLHRRGPQDDGSTKEVHVVGHISRPAFGEGRQTPDRQMFFVNARPCGLPQVAKAFNEVYKSYNNSQSPFIFANIELDTHLYDVNVSPDKRTIMLHDQARMLEQLKISLTQLFESQEYTVPVSQIRSQRQPLLRQTSIKTLILNPGEASPAAAEPTDGEGEPEDESQSEIEDENEDEEEPETDEPLEASERGHRRHQDNPDRQAVSLMSKWLDKNADSRKPQTEAGNRQARARKDGLSMAKGRLVEMLGEESVPVETANTSNGESRTSLHKTPASPKTQIPVRDVNIHVTEMENGGGTLSVDYAAGRSEDPIPAFRSPSRMVSVSVLGPSERQARHLRTTATMATITIGNHTVTSPIGSPSPKKPRIEKHGYIDQALPSLPSFGSRLSQRFAAAGSTEDTQASDDSLVEAEEENRSSGSIQVELLASASQSEHEESDLSPEQDIAVEDSSLFVPYDDVDGDYMDEDEKRAKEVAKVQEMIKVAEEEGARPSDENVKRAQLLLKGSSKRKISTTNLVQALDTTVEKIQASLRSIREALSSYTVANESGGVAEELLDSDTAEEKLSLTINKSDFETMKIVGQFNLGFILASRTITPTDSTSRPATDDLFIIDQHASDEKYNFERLQAITVVQSQRLVRPKPLNLTAVEEEIVLENLSILETNGFIVTIDTSGAAPVGQRCHLVSLPMSRETTFSLSDLEELISLLADHPSGGSAAVPRPSKVRKMFAMRACRSSVMIGRTLTVPQMRRVVRHMGEIDKPWNCPHGRPTMRHLFKLGAWDEVCWKEGKRMGGDGDGDGESEVGTDWASYIEEKNRT